MKKEKVSWKAWIEAWFPAAYEHVYISYLPNKDRYGREFDVELWETEALKIQARLFRGATSYPARGSYRVIDAEGNIRSGIMLEKTRMIVSFASETELTASALAEATNFLQRFGQKTNQESVAFCIDGEMYYLDLSEKTILRQKEKPHGQKKIQPN
ncbi:MAG TPA: hypothetical protein DIW61_08125 [Candidatus Aminicenantes bacterium]|nr:hypothetical protein [Candidatus Aminicenantes bacterium]